MPHTMSSLSITQHFQFLADCAHALQNSIQNDERCLFTQSTQTYQTTFHNMSVIGLKIEQHSDPYQLQADTHLIEDQTVAFGPKKSFPHVGKAGDTLDYHLPTISDMGTFIAVCCYLKYLKNYQKVSYQGGITFFLVKLKIDAGVEKNKPRFHSKACFIDKEIKNYCKKNHIAPSPVFKLIDQAVNGKLVNDLTLLLDNQTSQKNVVENDFPELSLKEAKLGYEVAHRAHASYLAKLHSLQDLEKHIDTLKERTSGFVGKQYRAFFDASSDAAKLVKAKARHKELKSELAERQYGAGANEYLHTLATEEKKALQLCDQAIARSHGL